MLGYEPGLASPHIGHFVKSKWKLRGTLTACTGTQAGGRPTARLPISGGDVTINARATGHQCGDVAAHGLEIRRIRVLWRDAHGGSLGSTRVATGSIDVDNVEWVPLTLPPPPPPDPSTFVGAGTAISSSRVFPGQAVSLAAIGDPIHFVLPCSTTDDVPGISRGVPGVTFSGINGPSTLTVAP
jgi:hypothetical protein